MSDNDSLAIFSRGAQMLAEANTIQKAKELKDLAITATEWAKRKGMGEEVVQSGRSYALDAERRMGEILLETPRNTGAKGIGPIAVTTDDPNQPPSLKTFGVTKQEASKAQTLAKLPEGDFDDIKKGKQTRVQVFRKQKEAKKEARREENRQKVAKVETLPDAKYSTIVLDPPWDWGDEGDVDQFGRSRPAYDTMSIEKITALPVPQLSDSDCHIYLWITNRSLPKGFNLLNTWEFRYITCLTWCKPHFGQGNYFRGQTEQVLFGVKGSQQLLRKNAGTWFAGKRGPDGHSSKPDEFYDLVESCSPGPILEMFSRRNRKGWVSWGADAQ